jgi:hypothetical protein
MIGQNPPKNKEQAPVKDDDNNSSIGSGSDPSASSDPDATSQTTSGGEHDLRRKIIHEEERNVKRARILVGIAFLLCASAVTAAVYLFTTQSEQEAFENEVSHPKHSNGLTTLPPMDETNLAILSTCFHE